MKRSLLVLTPLACTLVLAIASVSAAADARLVEAAKRQDKAAVQRLLQGKADVNSALPDGTTALHWAANRNDLTVAGLLLKAGAKVDAANDYGVTPLSLAASNGSADLLDLLLKAGANPNLALPTGESPLMSASRSGSVAAVKTLLDHKADPNLAEPEMGQTALMWALSENHVPVAQALVERGAQVNARSKSGFTPLMFATRRGNLDAVKFLLGKGAGLNDTATDGVSVLMVAVLRGHATLAEFLLEAGADPNIDKAGYTALHWAAGKWESGMTHDYPNSNEAEWRYLIGVPDGKIRLIKSLLKHGAKVDAVLAKRPPRYGINLFNSVRVDGATPFWLASLSADVEVMKLLIEAGADPKVKNKDDVTALMAAAGLGRVPGDSLITDDESVAACAYLLGLGADVNAVAKSGDTALHGTAYYGNEKTAVLLVEKGADMAIKNRKGETAVKVADGYQANAMVLARPEVAAALRKLGAKD